MLFGRASRAAGHKATSRRCDYCCGPIPIVVSSRHVQILVIYAEEPFEEGFLVAIRPKSGLVILTVNFVGTDPETSFYSRRKAKSPGTIVTRQCMADQYIHEIGLR